MITKKRVAILVDGSFFIKMHLNFFKQPISANCNIPYPETASQMATNIQNHCMKHINNDDEELYRIYFYDCKPLSKKVTYPISKATLDLSQTKTSTFRNELYKELIKKPCFALRMGYLDEKNGEWKLKGHSTMKDLLANKIAISDLQDENFIYYAKQKGVDMKIGIDIARLAFKNIVEKIVLISGDSDFVPAAKLARTEGLHFTLDPMGNNIKDDLREHIDWLHTTLPLNTNHN